VSSSWLSEMRRDLHSGPAQKGRDEGSSAVGDPLSLPLPAPVRSVRSGTLTGSLA